MVARKTYYSVKSITAVDYVKHASFLFKHDSYFKQNLK